MYNPTKTDTLSGHNQPKNLQDQAEKRNPCCFEEDYKHHSLSSLSENIRWNFQIALHISVSQKELVQNMHKSRRGDE